MALVVAHNSRQVSELKGDPTVRTDDLIDVMGHERDPRRVGFDGDDFEIIVLLRVLHEELLSVLMKLDARAEVDELRVEDFFEVAHFCSGEAPIVLVLEHPVGHEQGEIWVGKRIESQDIVLP